MVTIRYTQWDGTQKLKLDADKVFEKLAEYLSYTDDVRQAMDWMMRQGMDFDGVRVMGLDEFIEQLRQEMRQRYRDFNLKNALSEMEQKLEDILNQERQTLERSQGQETRRRGQRARDFADAASACPRRSASSKATTSRTRRPRRTSTQLLAEYENIRDLENFRDRNQHMFHGPKSLDYRGGARADARDGADAPARAGSDVGQLRHHLDGGLAAAPRAASLADFQNLKQVMVLLAQSGYMMPKGDHYQLSPKGVRRIGQLALRDIYQNLLKDRSGGHMTDYRGVTEMRPDETTPLQLRRSAQPESGRDPQACARAPARRTAATAPRRLRNL